MCRKEAQPITPASSPDTAYNPGPKIRAFITSAKEPRQTKSNGAFTIRDAEWNIEAALNMGRVDPNARFGDTRSVKYTYRMDVVDDMVEEDDVLSGYLALEADLDATEMDYYEQATVVDVINEIDGTEVLFTAEMFIGKNPDGPVSNGPPNTVFTSGHKCRVTSIGVCATSYPGDKEIKNRVNYGLGIYPCCITDVETWTVTSYLPTWPPFPIQQVDLNARLIPTALYPNPSEDALNRNDNFLIYRSELCTGFIPLDCEPCIVADDMSMLTQGAYDVMLDVFANYVTNPNTEPIVCNIHGYAITYNNGTTTPDMEFYHTASFTYGRWYDGSLEGE